MDIGAPSLKCHLNAAENNKVISITGIRRAQRVFVSLEAEVEKVLHIAIQIPVRPEVKRLGAIRLHRAVSNLQIGIAEFQLPCTEARLAIFVAEQIMLRRYGSGIGFLL